MLRTKSSQLSFYGNHIYDRVIPKDHFLKLLNKVVDFSLDEAGDNCSPEGKAEDRAKIC